MGDATRYLCAAAYLDDRFRRKLLIELIYRTHRAPAPSYGAFDVAPVLMHCLRARRLALVRDLGFIALLIGGLWLSPIGVGLYVALAVPFAALSVILSLIPRRRAVMPAWFRQSPLAAIIGLGIVTYGVGSLITVAGGAVAGHQAYVSFGLFLLAALVISVAHRFYVLRLLRKDLAPGETGPAPDARDSWTSGQIDWVAGAQFGNVTLYSGKNPFIGAGDPSSALATVWSFTMELDRPRAGSDSVMAVDPWELHEHIRRSMEAMATEYPEALDGGRPDGAEPLPPNARIASLDLGYQVIGRGECAQYERFIDPTESPAKIRGHPLIDAESGVPYSQASAAACKAIIKHPQAALRCYQRVTVGAQQQAVWQDDHALLPAENPEIVVSAFIYVAVEGRMLYTDFIATALPPIPKRFRVVDELPSCTPAQFLRHIIRTRWSGLMGDGILAPFRIAGTLAAMTYANAFAEYPEPSSKIKYDYGARVSSRELGAQAEPATYTDVLDAHKYINMITQRMNGAVLDHLTSRNVDTSSYRSQMSQITNLNVAGNNYGMINLGAGQATQNIRNVRGGDRG
jgi:hypothetical protein